MLTGLSLGGLCGCVQEPPAFDPRAAQEWELRRDAEVKAKPMYPLPTTEQLPTAPGETPEGGGNHFGSLNVPEGPPVLMSLQEIIHRAMANNMEIRVASFDTAVDQTRVMEAEANFDPTLFSDINEQRIDKITAGTEAASPAANINPNTNNASAAFPRNIIARYDEEQLFTSDLGIRENLPAGGKAEFKQEVDNSWFNPARALLRSWYETDLTFTLTQPLLQNFGVEVNRARITVAQNNQRVSLMDFRKTVEDTVLKIEQTYWQLVQAQRDVQTTKKLLKETDDLQNVLLRRLGNDVTLVQVEQVVAAHSDRQVQLIQQQTLVEQLSDQLKQLMNDPEFPVSSSPIVTAVDDGSEAAMHFNLDDQIETAMENRYELGQQQARIDSAEISVLVAKNNLLPSLNAQLQATVDGLGKDIGTAWGKEGDFNHWGYQAGLQFEFPLGDRAAQAIWQRALLQRMQAIASYAGLVNQIAFDVKTAARQVDATWARLSRAREARLHYEKLLEKLKTQVDAGNQQLTFDFIINVVQDQQALAQAEQTEHLALNDYNFAIATLEKNKGTILRYDNVIMEQEQLPFDMAIRGGSLARQMLLGEPTQRTEKPIMPVVPPPVLHTPDLAPTTQPGM
jgi:outer membrane protein TolC